MRIQQNSINPVIRIGFICVIAIVISSLTIADACAQRGRGGGGRGGGGARGGGGGRAPSQSYNRSPSMSRQSTPRQSKPANRAPSNRSGSATNRGGTAGNRAGAQPNRGGANTNRGGANTRQGAIGQAGRGANPSKSTLNSFLDVGGQGGNRAEARPSGGNKAVNDFFNHDASSQNITRRQIRAMPAPWPINARKISPIEPTPAPMPKAVGATTVILLRQPSGSSIGPW